MNKPDQIPSASAASPTLRCGVFVPNLGPFGDGDVLIDLAQAAEHAGWDGFFIWDHILGDLSTAYDVVDPWVVLAAIAVKTERIRIGALITPLSRRRPWKVARETATLDRLSRGRLIFGAGLGTPIDAEFEAFGEEPDPRERARLLDAGLSTLDALWRGGPITVVNDPDAPGIPGFQPTPHQTPRPPVWIGGRWPNKPPFRRAARWDGVFPVRTLANGEQLEPEHLREIRQYVSEHRDSTDPLDVILSGASSPEPMEARKAISPYMQAGLTWWLEEARVGHRFSVGEIRQRITAGPPAPEHAV